MNCPHIQKKGGEGISSPLLSLPRTQTPQKSFIRPRRKTPCFKGLHTIPRMASPANPHCTQSPRLRSLAPTEPSFPQKDGEPMLQVHCIWSIKQVQLSMASRYFYRPLAVIIVYLLF
jgi:hypothetical protein